MREKSQRPAIHSNILRGCEKDESEKDDSELMDVGQFLVNHGLNISGQPPEHAADYVLDRDYPGFSA